MQNTYDETKKKSYTKFERVKQKPSWAWIFCNVWGDCCLQQTITFSTGVKLLRITKSTLVYKHEMTSLEKSHFQTHLSKR